MAAGLRHLVFSASFVVLLAVTASSAPQAAELGARNEVLVWTVPPPRRNGSGDTPNRWAARHRFHVGDVLDFKNWKGSVLVVRRRDYEWYAASSSPAFRFADGGKGNAASTTMFMLGLSGRRGFFYFIDAARPRCEAGQRMAVRVAVRYPSATSGAPAPEDAPNESFPSDQPWKKVAYAVLVLLAGGVFTFCLVFCFIRCCGNH